MGLGSMAVFSSTATFQPEVFYGWPLGLKLAVVFISVWFFKDFYVLLLRPKMAVYLLKFVYAPQILFALLRQLTLLHSKNSLHICSLCFFVSVPRSDFPWISWRVWTSFFFFAAPHCSFVVGLQATTVDLKSETRPFIQADPILIFC